MIYTVGEMAKMLDVPASTLRYYDKEGLLPFVERSPGGIRMFQESDYGWLKIISCLKKAGMPLKDIREYINLAYRAMKRLNSALNYFISSVKSCVRRWQSFRKLLIHLITSAGIMKPPKKQVQPMHPKPYRLKRFLPNTAKLADDFTMRTEYIL